MFVGITHLEGRNMRSDKKLDTQFSSCTHTNFIVNELIHLLNISLQGQSATAQTHIERAVIRSTETDLEPRQVVFEQTFIALPFKQAAVGKQPDFQAALLRVPR